MKLYSLETGNFKLDGGAMFGVVPKMIWNKSYPSDEKNLIGMAARSLLIDTGNRLILIDSGIGNKQDQSFLKHYHLYGENTLEKSLNKLGYKKEDITDNILTHLHFDHCGGSVDYCDDHKSFLPAFKNAKYYIGKAQWESANNPNSREKATYLNENYIPLYESGQLKLIEKEEEILPCISIKIFNGHTDGQLIPHIRTNKGTVVFMADLIPFTTHIHLPFIMSYDIRAVDSLKEKEFFLIDAIKYNYILFFQHDIYNECCRVELTEKGYRPYEVSDLVKIFNN
ncbi:MAG: MBL fold metallo-hydrolase [Bacteroidota bacterium]